MKKYRFFNPFTGEAPLNESSKLSQFEPSNFIFANVESLQLPKNYKEEMDKILNVLR